MTIPLNVVAAIIENPQGQLLIAERPADILLTRDVAPQSLEGQRWRWVSRAEIANYRFPEPNTAVLQKLQNGSTH